MAGTSLGCSRSRKKTLWMEHSNPEQVWKFPDMGAVSLSCAHQMPAAPTSLLIVTTRSPLPSSQKETHAHKCSSVPSPPASGKHTTAVCLYRMTYSRYFMYTSFSLLMDSIFLNLLTQVCCLKISTCCFCDPLWRCTE